MRVFHELAEVFQKLEHTSSNLALVAILAAFLSRLNPDEAKAVVYLLRGEVAAPAGGGAHRQPCPFGRASSG